MNCEVLIQMMMDGFNENGWKKNKDCGHHG